MQEPTVTHSTFVIEKSYAAGPERVFAAFADPARKRKWYGESAGRDVLEYSSDFRVGGSERTLSKFKEGTPFPGATLTAESTFLDIVEKRRIVFAYTMSMDGRRFSTSLATVELLPTAKGTDLIFTDQSAFFEGSDGAQMREAGWRKLLDNLGNELGQ